ncbi:MAG TPA: ATP synthase subunit I, partial [Pyrinomonadaceae bacterium]|nr:ATP synthase subunit I [Pyrinomonadaceae bacterium]
MSEGPDSARPRAPVEAEEDPRAAERRIFRDTCIAAGVAVAVSACLAPWRLTAGLLLGGALAVFNHYWLRESVASVFGGARPGRRARLGAARYVLRYLVVAAFVYAAATLGVASLVATLAGLCAVVPALLAE